jgi:hypothetical protein
MSMYADSVGRSTGSFASRDGRPGPADVGHPAGLPPGRSSGLVRGWAGLLVAMLVSPAWGDFEAPAPPPNVPPPSAEARPWDLSIRAFVGYNDNVQLVPDSSPFFVGDHKSAVMGLQVRGLWRLEPMDGLTITPVVQLEQTFHTDDAQSVGTPNVSTNDANDYDLTVIAPGLEGRYAFAVTGLPAFVSLRYDYRYEEADVHAAGLDNHTVTGVIGISATPQLELSLAYAHTWQDFDLVFPPTGLNGRDADLDTITATATYRFTRRCSLDVSYQYLNNASEGTNFDYESHGVRARFETHLVGPLWGAVMGGYRRGDYMTYTGFVPPPGRTRQDIYDVGVQLIYVIDRHWSVDVFYQHSTYESNSAVFEADENIVGAGVTFRF